jgi:hypothetical protein
MMEGIMEVGRYFILYKVKEVGSFPIGHIRTTQLVAPLNLHPSVLLCFLALILMVLSHVSFDPQPIFGSLVRCPRRRVPLKAGLVILPRWFR